MLRKLLFAMLLTSMAVSAQIYRTTDEQGNVVFTDTPPAGAGPAEAVELQQINTTPAPPTRTAPQAEQQPEEEASPLSVSIVNPAPETSIPMGPGNFSVDAKVAPGLGSDESLQLYIDSVPWGGPQRETSWALTNIFRGAHDLTVAVINGEGEQLANSDPIRVFVHRPSVNFRNR